MDEKIIYIICICSNNFPYPFLPFETRSHVTEASFVFALQLRLVRTPDSPASVSQVLELQARQSFKIFVLRCFLSGD